MERQRERERLWEPEGGARRAEKAVRRSPAVARVEEVGGGGASGGRTGLLLARGDRRQGGEVQRRWLVAGGG